MKTQHNYLTKTNHSGVKRLLSGIATAAILSNANAQLIQNPGEYRLVDADGLYNPICHDPFWTTEIQDYAAATNDPVLQFGPLTSGYHVQLYAERIAEEADESITIPVGPDVRTFVEYLPVACEVPVGIGVTYLSAVSGSIKIDTGDRYPNNPNTCSASFFNQLSATGPGGTRATVFDNANLPPEGPNGNFIAYSGQLPGGVNGDFELINGKWIAKPTLPSSAGFATATLFIPPRVPEPRETWAKVEGNYAKAFKLVEIAGRQIASGWIGADINADNEVSAADFERVVNSFGTTPSDLGWDPFADTDGDGEVGGSDFEAIVENFGYDITFAMSIPGPPDPKNTFPYYNFSNF